MTQRTEGPFASPIRACSGEGTLRPAARPAPRRRQLAKAAHRVGCIATESDPKAVAVHVCVNPSDSSAEVVFTNPHVHNSERSDCLPQTDPGQQSHLYGYESTSPAIRSGLDRPPHAATIGPDSDRNQPILANVPHLALGLLGIAVVLVWGLVEFAVVQFSGSQELAWCKIGRRENGGGARIGEEAGSRRSARGAGLADRRGKGFPTASLGVDVATSRALLAHHPRQFQAKTP